MHRSRNIQNITLQMKMLLAVCHENVIDINN